MKLKGIFENVVIGALFVGGALVFHGGASLAAFPSHNSLFLNDVHAQVVEAFPSLPTEGAHTVSIDFGKASEAASQARWDYAKVYGGLLAGGAALAGASLAYLIRTEQKNDWATPRRG